MPTAEIGALRIAGILGNMWENMGKTLEFEVVPPRWQSLGLFPVQGALKVFANVGFYCCFPKHWERGLRASGEVWGSLVALGNHPGHSPSPPFPGSLHFLPAGAQSILINPKETPGDFRAGKSFGDKSLFQRLITFNWINPFGSGIIFCSCFCPVGAWDLPGASRGQLLCSWCWGGCGEGFPSWEDFSTAGNGFSLLESLWESFNCADQQQGLAVFS